MERARYSEIVSDPNIRGALSGVLGRVFWKIASDAIWNAYQEHLRDEAEKREHTHDWCPTTALLVLRPTPRITGITSAAGARLTLIEWRSTHMTSFKRLRDYPRPDRDTAIGPHDSPWNVRLPDNYQAFGEKLLAHGMAWFKALGAGDNKVGLVATLTGLGIECIVREYWHQGHPRELWTPERARAYVGAGAHYLETGNEAHHEPEWAEDALMADGSLPPDAPQQVGQQFLDNEKIVTAAGGIALTPAVDIGGHWPGYDFFKRMFDYILERADSGITERIAIALHNRPLNHPPTYPYDEVNQADKPGTTIEDDWSCWLMYEAIDNYVRSRIGRSLPILGTEAGYSPFSDQDSRYPQITWQSHRDLNLELMRGFGEGDHGDAMFCFCYWYGEAEPEDNRWYRDSLWNNRRFGGNDTPLAVAMREEVWKERKFSDAFYQEEEPEVPEPTEPTIVLGFKAFHDKYNDQLNIGKPMSNEYGTLGGGSGQEFENGFLLWHPRREKDGGVMLVRSTLTVPLSPSQ
jgi:hypothetical protein